MKTILITGSTDGIGKLVAFQLAKEGHQILLHGRNERKLADTVAEIKEATKNSAIESFIEDFSDLNSVTSMTLAIKEKVSKIDILINNAGIFKSQITKSNDGFDIRFAVNYLTPYILTKELLPLIEKGNAPRIINLSSAAQSTVCIDALLGKQELSDQGAYAQSKLALTIWSFDLAKKHKDINTIAVNPGSLLNTKMVNEAYGQYWSSADKGSNILYDLAVSEVYSNSSGQYFDNDKGSFSTAHSDAYDADKIAELIAVTESIFKA
ncbi:SDR family NAD(P)-dependent oxidoreductase [Winogradskyella sp. PG-2]|uniref:SDR family NAD(P)-dependent oxidoreductase n=1 Tax=Winogradskyella sp. PG-2 TaxID=754409 RepID=UPI0004586B3B|nr:SDR family NAD(P)-dependent oxidoreductase [Winogradskyella sp. PG-2]BAO77019.1 probable oxidoreductase [Winogradskyella sp. PG-2]